MGIMSQKVRTIYFSLFALVFVIAIPLILLYATGYSFDTAFNLSWRGGVYVYVPESDVDVFIGNNIRVTTSLLQREVLEKSLHPGNYLILAAHEDYWPWAKFVEVKPGEVVSKFPLLVPKVMPFEQITRTSPEYKTAAGLFATSTPGGGVRVESNDIEISAIGREVVVNWLAATSSAPHFFCLNDVANLDDSHCSTSFTVFRAAEDIEFVDFYPGRDDAIILTLGNGVYAVELDRSAYHNVYPIFRGTNPEVRVIRNTIYVKDADYIISAELQS